MDKKQRKEVPNVSGSFQVSSEEQQKSLKEVKDNNKLDDESMYYARLFMED